MLLGTLATILLGNILIDKEIKAEIAGVGVIRLCEGTIRACQDF